MKKYTKVLCILIFLIGIIFLFQKVSFGTEINVDSIIDGMKDVDQVGMGKGSNKFVRVINSAIRLLQVAGTGISVIVVTWLGVKYMLASSNEKADIKKMAMPVIIGCVLLFAATNLVAIIASVGTSLNDKTTTNNDSTVTTPAEEEEEDSENNRRGFPVIRL